MLSWVETHGFECLLVCFAWALITSVMPAMTCPRFWVTWLYNIVKVSGANADAFVRHSPAGQNLERLVSDTSQQSPDGSTAQQHVESLSIPKT